MQLLNGSLSCYTALLGRGLLLKQAPQAQANTPSPFWKEIEIGQRGQTQSLLQPPATFPLPAPSVRWQASAGVKMRRNNLPAPLTLPLPQPSKWPAQGSLRQDAPAARLPAWGLQQPPPTRDHSAATQLPCISCLNIRSTWQRAAGVHHPRNPWWGRALWYLLRAIVHHNWSTPPPPPQRMGQQ